MCPARPYLFHASSCIEAFKLPQSNSSFPQIPLRTIKVAGESERERELLACSLIIGNVLGCSSFNFRWKASQPELYVLCGSMRKV